MLKYPKYGYQLAAYGVRNADELKNLIGLFLRNYQKLYRDLQLKQSGNKSNMDPQDFRELAKETSLTGNYLEKIVKNFLKEDPSLSATMSDIEKKNDNIPVMLKSYKANGK